MIQRGPRPPAGTADDLPKVELWAERLVFAPNAMPGERVVKGTSLAVEALVGELEKGRTEEELLKAYPELTAKDVDALRHYARVPAGLRRAFGAWAEDVEELDKYLEWTRQQRRIERRGMVE